MRRRDRGRVILVPEDGWPETGLGGEDLSAAGVQAAPQLFDAPSASTALEGDAALDFLVPDPFDEFGAAMDEPLAVPVMPAVAETPSPVDNRGGAEVPVVASAEVQAPVSALVVIDEEPATGGGGVCAAEDLEDRSGRRPRVAGEGSATAGAATAVSADRRPAGVGWGRRAVVVAAGCGAAIALAAAALMPSGSAEVPGGGPVLVASAWTSRIAGDAQSAGRAQLRRAREEERRRAQEEERERRAAAQRQRAGEAARAARSARAAAVAVARPAAPVTASSAAAARSVAAPARVAPARPSVSTAAQEFRP